MLSVKDVIKSSIYNSLGGGHESISQKHSRYIASVLPDRVIHICRL